MYTITCQPSARIFELASTKPKISVIKTDAPLLPLPIVHAGHQKKKSHRTVTRVTRFPSIAIKVKVGDH